MLVDRSGTFSRYRGAAKRLSPDSAGWPAVMRIACHPMADGRAGHDRDRGGIGIGIGGDGRAVDEQMQERRIGIGCRPQQCDVGTLCSVARRTTADLGEQLPTVVAPGHRAVVNLGPAIGTDGDHEARRATKGDFFTESIDLNPNTHVAQPTPGHS